MAFDLNSWKTKLSENLKDWKPRMQHAGVNSTYAMLAAASLIPVAEAARQGEWAALSALGVVVAGVGTNLVANMIQSWKDESNGAKEIEHLMKEDPVLRAELDAVLTKLDTLTLAAQELSQGDRKWFERTIQKELAALGSSVNYEAKLIGDGAIAQGNGAIAVSKGGAYTKGNHNIIATGDRTTINLSPDPQQIEAGKQAKLLRNYLERQLKECQQLSLAALGGEEGSEDDVTLEKVFVELDTTQKVKVENKKAKKKNQADQLRPDQDERPVSAQEAFKKNPQLALLGDPGSGKSTFVKYLLAWQASAELGENKIYPPGCEKGLLPVLVTLRDFNPAFTRTPAGRTYTFTIAGSMRRGGFAGALRIFDTLPFE